MAGHSDTFHHVRDSIFFEVPRILTSSPKYDGEQSAPWYVIEALHLHHPSLDEVNTEMQGKILIPQPFAGASAEHPGLLLTKFMVLQLVGEHGLGRG